MFFFSSPAHTNAKELITGHTNLLKGIISDNSVPKERIIGEIFFTFLNLLGLGFFHLNEVATEGKKN